jgi:hypothetical protein
VDARLSYAVPSVYADRAFAWALHERRVFYPAPRMAAGSSSRSITPCWHVPAASAPPGLHLEPGQKGTEHLVEQYGDRLICVHHRS